MALERTLQVWQTAQRLQEAGPFDYYQLTAAQHTLLETSWQGLYPSTPYPCTTRSCPGRIREAHRQILAELKYYLSENPGLQLDSQAPTPQANTVNQPTTTAAAAAAKVAAAKTSTRYRFAKGVTEVREFGNPIAHTKVTDELVERLAGISLDYLRLFVDTEEQEELENLDSTEEELEQEPSQEELALQAAQQAAQAGATTATGAKVIDLNASKPGPQEKLPSPSQVKQMNSADVRAQYLLELSTEEVAITEVPAELDTNAKVAAAIIDHREKLADQD